jgi:hypothetical protein
MRKKDRRKSLEGYNSVIKTPQTLSGIDVEKEEQW